MIRPPSRFRVLGQAFQVRVTDSTPADFLHASVGGNDMNTQQAFVRSDLSAHQQMETYFHEALHAVFYLGGLRHHVPDDEAVINTLAPQLLHFLRDNPRVVKYLLQPVDA